MKLFQNSLLVILCFNILGVGNTKAQDTKDLEIEAHQYLMQAFLLGADTVGQSFYHFSNNDPVHIISFAAFDLRSIEDRVGELIIFQGEGLGGSVVFDTTILISGINKFYPPSVIATVVDENQDLALWADINDSIMSEVFDFTDVKVEYLVNRYLPEGQYTAVITTDINVPNIYNSGAIYAPELVCYLNCSLSQGCDGVNNPYTEGRVVVDQNHMTSVDMDMAFEVKAGLLATSISNESVQNFYTLVQNNIIVVPEGWQNGEVFVTNILGQKIIHKKVAVGDLIPLPSGQMSFITLIKKDKRQTNKVFVE